MNRRRFDHLVRELGHELGEAVPRFALWLRIHERGLDPENLTREEAVSLCGGFLKDFLGERGWRLGPLARRRLRRCVAGFEPPVSTPEVPAAALK
jgi:hypothetical protein